MEISVSHFSQEDKNDRYSLCVYTVHCSEYTIKMTMASNKTEALNNKAKQSEEEIEREAFWSQIPLSRNSSRSIIQLYAMRKKHRLLRLLAAVYCRSRIRTLNLVIVFYHLYTEMKNCLGMWEKRPLAKQKMT